MENQPLLPPGETPSNILAPSIPEVPSVQQQSWGAVISIVVIVLMIVIGAFYAWGERIAEEKELSAPSSL